MKNITFSDFNYGISQTDTITKHTTSYIEEWVDLAGRYHNINDEPARIAAGGKIMEWYSHGSLNRYGDKPAVINGLTGQFIYYKMGNRHREHAPAIIGMDHNAWYLCNKLHCATGPARTTRTNQTNSVVWALYGKHMDFDTWANCTTLSDEQLVLLKLQYY